MFLPEGPVASLAATGHCELHYISSEANHRHEFNKETCHLQSGGSRADTSNKIIFCVDLMGLR